MTRRGIVASIVGLVTSKFVFGKQQKEKGLTNKEMANLIMNYFEEDKSIKIFFVENSSTEYGFLMKQRGKAESWYNEYVENVLSQETDDQFLYIDNRYQAYPKEVIELTYIIDLRAISTITVYGDTELKEVVANYSKTDGLWFPSEFYQVHIGTRTLTLDEYKANKNSQSAN